MGKKISKVHKSFNTIVYKFWGFLSEDEINREDISSDWQEKKKILFYDFGRKIVLQKQTLLVMCIADDGTMLICLAFGHLVPARVNDIICIYLLVKSDSDGTEREGGHFTFTLPIALAGRET